MQLPIQILRTDVIPLINIAWGNSFARVRSNRIAIAARGWNPLNRALPKHLEILKTMSKPIDLTETRSIIEEKDKIEKTYENEEEVNNLASSIDVLAGFPGTLLNDVLRHAIKSDAVSKNLNRRYKESKSIREAFEEDKQRVTAGNVFRNGKVILDEELLNI